MTYSVMQPCSKCKKEPTCADGFVIRGAVQGIIHQMSGYWEKGIWLSGMHQGSGSVEHRCTNFEPKTEPVKPI